MDDFKKEIDDMRQRMMQEPFEVGVRLAQCTMFATATMRLFNDVEVLKEEMRDQLYGTIPAPPQRPSMPPPQPQFSPPPNGYTGQLNGHQSQQFAPHGSFYEEEEDGFPNVVSRGYRAPQ